MRVRQAKLKSKFWALYPKIPSGLWHEAVSLVRAVQHRRDRSSPLAGSSGRPLPDVHFEFRDGDPPRRTGWSGPYERTEDGTGVSTV